MRSCLLKVYKNKKCIFANKLRCFMDKKLLERILPLKKR